KGIAVALKIYVLDTVDILRREVVPYLAKYKLPDWEERFGLAGTRVAQFGTLPQRRSQVLGAWRAAAGQGSATPTAKGILAPLLGYSPGTDVEIVETDWTDLRLLHGYGYSHDLVFPPGTTSVGVFVQDGAFASKAGARLVLPFDHSDLSLATFTL